VWLCAIEGLGLEFVTDTDVSTPIAGVDCREVGIDEADSTVSQWNAFNQVLRLLLNLDV